MNRLIKTAPTTLALIFALAAMTVPASAQTISGRVVDEERGSPIEGALVTLVDKEGEQHAQALSDIAGRFTISPPEAGEYLLRASRIGYRAGQSPLLALAADGVAELDMLLQPAPIGLEGIEVAVDVSVEAAEQLEIAGLPVRDLGNRWITRADIEAVEVKRDVGSVLEWSGIGGMQVLRPENTTTGSDPMGLCVSMVRANTFGGQRRCALVVVDGVTWNNIEAQYIDPNTVEAMAVLLPTEGAFMYGQRGEAGVLMLWTKRR
jgi:Carboxypeptidase regulatory-like domain